MTPRHPRRRRAARWFVLAALVASLGAGCGGAATPAVDADAAAAALETPPQAIWPSAEEAPLEQVRLAADRGARPELLDPVAAARAYLTAGLPPEAGDLGGAALRVGRFAAVDADTGEVAATGAGMSSTTVFLRRWSGTRSAPSGRPIWYVQGVSSTALAVLDPDHDGERLTGSLVPTAAGWLTIRVAGPDGHPLAVRRVRAEPHRLVDLAAPAPDPGGVVVTAVLVADDGARSVRAFRLGPA